jgi:HEAT repeat protein
MNGKDESLQQKIENTINMLKEAITESSKDNSKISSCLNSLQSIGTWHIIEPLKSVLEIPNISLEIQQKILELFGKIQDPRIVSLLAHYIEHSEKKLRNTAIKSLSLINNPKVTQYLIDALEDDDKWVKIFAMHGLTKNASPKVIKPLIRLLGDSEEEIRKEAILALNKIKTENIEDLLIDALGSDDRYIKLGVVSLLGDKNITKSIDALIPLIGSEDRRLNLLICNTLSTFSSQKALKPLLDYSLKEGEMNNRYLLCIQKMNESIIFPLIDIYLRDNTNIYSKSIEYLLSKMGFRAHELIIERISTEVNPVNKEKLNLLEKRMEK